MNKSKAASAIHAIAQTNIGQMNKGLAGVATSNIRSIVKTIGIMAWVGTATVLSARIIDKRINKTRLHSV